MRSDGPWFRERIAHSHRTCQKVQRQRLRSRRRGSSTSGHALAAGTVTATGRQSGPGHCTFVFLLCTIGIHLPSGPCISILKVYVVGDSSSMVTRDLNDWPPIVPSSV